MGKRKVAVEQLPVAKEAVASDVIRAIVWDLTGTGVEFPDPSTDAPAAVEFLPGLWANLRVGGSRFRLVAESIEDAGGFSHFSVTLESVSTDHTRRVKVETGKPIERRLLSHLWRFIWREVNMARTTRARLMELAAAVETTKRVAAELAEKVGGESDGSTATWTTGQVRVVADVDSVVPTDAGLCGAVDFKITGVPAAWADRVFKAIQQGVGG